jgi:hypothetical protein
MERSNMHRSKDQQTLLQAVGVGYLPHSKGEHAPYNFQPVYGPGRESSSTCAASRVDSLRFLQAVTVNTFMRVD